jgi:predicted nucleic acid-binding protein
MILIDTNVVSETMRSAPEPKVVAWLDAQSAETLYLSTVSLAELLFGIAALPEGRRKIALGQALVEKAALLFGERILSFDVAAAKTYATVMSRARQAGRAVGVADGQIASIAATHRLIIASRDRAPFEAAGIEIIDPWA